MKQKPLTLSIIGAGNMGSALCQAFVKQKVVAAKNIIVSDHDDQKLKNLQKLCGVRTTQNNQELLKSDFLLIAVKPQGFAELAKELKGKISPKTVVISIMAGISVTSIAEQLHHQRIVRAMPNTPALVGEGMTVWMAQKISDEERETAKKLFQVLGKELEVSDENLIHAATAVSASGPAYIFALTEAWMEGAVKTGFTEEEAKKLIFQTIRGAQKLMAESTDSPQILREKVTSKGGTTEAALKHLDEHEWKKVFSEAVVKAYNRAKELSQ